MYCFVFLAALLIGLATPALAQKRVALVIGNDTYDNLGERQQLKKARADAKSVGDMLRALGFDVIQKDDVTRSAFNGHWQDFLNKLSGGDTAAFYFAGHGVELGGRNYLLPRDVPNIRPGRDELLRRESLALPEFLTDLREKGTRLNLVILDACRDNPFEQVAGRTVGGARGLAVTEPPQGTFIMFSASTGETALDRLDDSDRNPNSVFTRQLLPLLKAPGVSLTDVAEQVRVSVHVLADTVKHRQTPAYYNQVLGRVCLAGGECKIGGATAPSTVLPAIQSSAAEAWVLLRDAYSTADLETYVARFGDTFYGDLAKRRLGELKSAAVAGKQAAEAEYAKKQPAQSAVAIQPSTPARCDGIEALIGNERRCLKPGAGKTDWFKDCPTCPEMVVAPTGRFTMGSPKDEPEREPFDKDSEDQLPVTIGKTFAVGRFAVTRAEFAVFVTATGHKTEGGCYAWTGTEWKLQADRNWRSPGFTQTDRHPVVCVNWNDAKAYVEWLSSLTGKSYRLLSEAEREYAARAGTTMPFWWGGAASTSQANYNGNYTYAGGAKGEWRKATVPVDTFAVNAWGLYNVHGNVWDWTEDCWNASNAGNPGNGGARSSGDCGLRVRRGGSWVNNPQDLRSAYRSRSTADDRDSLLGFRVARTLSPP